MMQTAVVEKYKMFSSIPESACRKVTTVAVARVWREGARCPRHRSPVIINPSTSVTTHCCGQVTTHDPGSPLTNLMTQDGTMCDPACTRRVPNCTED